jgi:hypothetical protein
MSLTAKLRTFRRTLARKQQLVFSDDQCKLISRHMPSDFETLKIKCGFSDTQTQAYGNKLLTIIATHERDQEKFEACFMEIRTFATGGLYAVQRLNKVYKNILSHFGMEGEKYDVFYAAGVYEDTETGKLRPYAKKEEEEFFC